VSVWVGTGTDVKVGASVGVAGGLGVDTGRGVAVGTLVVPGVVVGCGVVNDTVRQSETIFRVSSPSDVSVCNISAPALTRRSITSA
jgi:hypothetical protein